MLFLDGFANGVASIGEFVYATNIASGLFIIDVEDPTHPQVVETRSGLDRSARIYVHDGRALVAELNPRVHVFDIDSPGEPTSPGRMTLPGSAGSVLLQDDLAFFGINGGGFRIDDVSNFPETSNLAEPDSFQYLRGIDVHNNVAYLLKYKDGVFLADVSEPARPTTIPTSNAFSRARDVAFWGDIAYAVRGILGLSIFNVSEPNSLTLLGAYDTGGNAESCAVSEDGTYVVHWREGLQILDVSEPTDPHPLSFIPTRGFARDIVAADRLAFVAAGDAVDVIDASLPASPVVVASAPLSGSAGQLAIQGSLLAVSHSDLVVRSTVQLFDMSDPVLPADVASLEFRFANADVAIEGWLLCITEDRGFDNALHFNDIVDPSNPRLLSTVELPSSPNGVAMPDGVAYASTFLNGLHVVDVSG